MDEDDVLAELRALAEKESDEALAALRAKFADPMRPAIECYMQALVEGCEECVLDAFQDYLLMPQFTLLEVMVWGRGLEMLAAND